MKVMDHPVFRRFWYPVIPLAHLADGPKRFELLGQALALFVDGVGVPGALEDKCCHRSARLSMGTVCDGVLACPYHGWRYDRAGQCVFVPQTPDAPPEAHTLRKVRAFRCQARYGYAWVALDDPLYPIPRIPEVEAGGYRLLHEFYEPWRVAGLRVMENELDMAHPSFVHLGTFGTPEHLMPADAKVERFDGGLHYTSTLGVATAHHATERGNVRHMEATWFLPFTVRTRINYPDGPPHIIVNTLVPIDSHHSMMVQFCLLANDGRGMDAEKVLAFDRAVTLEDKTLLEGTDPDVPLDPLAERHIASDQPSIVMRQIVKELLELHEGRRDQSPA
jgi:phenylpropionate dioxygenase-like ring-hydroxylating dioxygenase large terminal subunit